MAAKDRNEETIERLLALAQSDPESVRRLVSNITSKMLIPHSEGQREALEATERYLVLCAGRRWGKSQCGAAKALREARKPKRIIWWVAPVYRNVKNGYNAVVNQCPEGLLAKPAPPDSSFDAGRAVKLQFKNGSSIQFFSAERHEGMLGASCDFVIMDEAATMPEHVWTQTIRPTLADRGGKALFISTPRGKNWFYNLWALGQDPNMKEYRSWRFPSRTNPTIPAAEFDSMEYEMPRAVYEQEILADFVSSAAAVFRYPTYEDENGLIQNAAIKEIVPATGHVILGIDLAKSQDFSVIYGVRADDRLPCYHDRFNHVSWPTQRRLIHQAVDEIMETATGITVLMDSTGLGDVVYDDLTEEGLDVVPIKFTPAWKTAAVQLLSADLERGQAFMIEEQEKEFDAFSYTITPGGRWQYSASTGHDDEVAAALLAHWGVVHSGVPNVQTLTADTNVGSDDVDWASYDEGTKQDTGLPQTVEADVSRYESYWG